MNQTVKNTLNPKHPTGGYALPYAPVLIALGLLIAFLAGAFASRHFDAKYFQAHNPSFIHLDGSEFHALPIPHVLTPPPPSASVDFRWLPAPSNQDGSPSCSAEAFTHQLGFLVNRLDHTHIAYSARWFYDLADQGLGKGTRPEQYVAIDNVRGAVRHHFYDYPPYALTATPPIYPVEHHPTWDQWLWIGENPGMAGVEQAKARIAAGKPVDLGITAFSSIYDAATTGHYDLPGPGVANLGGHDITLVSYDDNHCFNGVCGWFLAENSWGRNFGVGSNGQAQPAGHNGFFFISYRFVSIYGDQAAAVHLGIHSNTYGLPAAPKPFKYYPSHAPLHQAPVKVGPPGFTAGSSRPQVYNVRTADTGVNIAPAINAAANFYGFSAPGFAALMGVESGIRQYAPHYPISGAGYCDYSAGLTQITVCTAAGLGVGDGSTSQANINYVFNYEQADPIRDVWLSARLVADFKRQVGWDWPWLYSSWNEGPGHGLFSPEYRYPSNSITQNALASYLNWYNLIYARNVRYGPPPAPPPPPKPKPRYRFPGGTWESYRIHHHLRHIPHTWHGKLSQAATVWWTVQGRKGRELCGGIVKPEVWHPHGPGGRDGFERNVFQGCRILLWSNHRDWQPKIIRTRWRR